MGYICDLKSSLDRFIDSATELGGSDVQDLKSSLDRFIDKDKEYT